MKTLKKILGGVVAFLMLCVIATSSFATTITVEKDPSKTNLDGRTFTAYQIFSGRKDDVDDKEVLSDVQWGSAFSDEIKQTVLLSGLQDSKTFGSKFKDLTVDKPAEIAKAMDGFTEADGIELAKIIYDALADTTTKKIPNEITHTDLTKTNDSYTANVDTGYYLIVDETTTGSVNPAVLQVVGDITIKPKTEDVVLKKTVLDSENGKADSQYESSADYNIGEDVPFRLAAKVPMMTHYDEYKFQFADTLSAGLSLNEDSVKVYVASDEKGTTNKAEITGNQAVLNTNPGTITLNNTTTINPSFTVTLADLKTTKGTLNGQEVAVEAGNWIIVEYTARLNEQAIFKNDNKVQLIYSNNPNTGGDGFTDEQKVYVFTFTLDGTKVDGTTKLKDAEFAITRNVPDLDSEEDGATKVQYRAKSTDNKVVWKDLGDQKIDKVTDAEIFKSAEETGLFEIKGLDAGDYELWEVKAPAGYNTPKDPFKIKIEAEHDGTAGTVTSLTLKIDDSTITEGNAGAGNTGTLAFNIQNNKGTTLPETGGMGTTMLYVAGGILLVGSAVLLVTKKRMGHEG